MSAVSTTSKGMPGTDGRRLSCGVTLSDASLFSPLASSCRHSPPRSRWRTSPGSAYSLCHAARLWRGVHARPTPGRAAGLWLCALSDAGRGALHVRRPREVSHAGGGGDGVPGVCRAQCHTDGSANAFPARIPPHVFVAHICRGAGGHLESVAPVETCLGRMAALKQHVQPRRCRRRTHGWRPGCQEAQRAVVLLPRTSSGAWMAIPASTRGGPLVSARYGPTRGGMALKWPHAIDRYRERREADAASALHQEK